MRYNGGSSATTQFFQKLPQENNAWTLVFEDDSYVGLDGADNASEEYSRTPMGDFKVLEAFGIRNNPGTSLEYVQFNLRDQNSDGIQSDAVSFYIRLSTCENGQVSYLLAKYASTRVFTFSFRFA